MKKRNLRIGMSVFGVIICGIAIGFFHYSALGVDPFQTFMVGLNKIFPINYGLLYIIACAILLIFTFIADKHYIGIATFINLFFMGYIIDFVLKILQSLLPEPSIFIRILSLAFGVVLLCVASSFYFVADLGVSPYDSISLIVANTWGIGQFKYCRIISDLICVSFGSSFILLSGGSLSYLITVVGIGTIITAFFMGPLIDFFIRTIAAPILNR